MVVEGWGLWTIGQLWSEDRQECLGRRAAGMAAAQGQLTLHQPPHSVLRLPTPATPAVPNSVLFLGRPGVGKTTVIREMARVLSGELSFGPAAAGAGRKASAAACLGLLDALSLSRTPTDELHKRVVIVDTSCEIGGKIALFFASGGAGGAVLPCLQQAAAVAALAPPARQHGDVQPTHTPCSAFLIPFQIAGDGDVPHPAIGGARRMQVRWAVVAAAAVVPAALPPS